MQYFFTATPRMVDTQYGFDGVEIGSIRITWTRVIGAGAALVAFARLYLVLRYHPVRPRHARDRPEPRGRADGRHPAARRWRATPSSWPPACAAWRVRRISPIQLVTPYMGQFMIFKAFALVIIGGLGNIPGAIAAAIALGLIESWIGGFFEIVWQEAAVFVIMIVVLFVRAGRAVQARRHAGRMKLVAALAGVAACGRAAAASPPRTTSSALRVSALIFTVAAAALNLVYGFTGLLSFAQLGFWGIGGYATALTVDDLRRQFLDGPV